MTPAEIIEQVGQDGVVLALSDTGNVKAIGDQSAVNRWLQTIRDNKPSILCELHREARRQKTIAMLGAARKYAVLVENPDTDPVIATVAIRGWTFFEMEIPHHSYDGLALLELVEKHSAEISTEKDAK